MYKYTQIYILLYILFSFNIFRCFVLSQRKGVTSANDLRCTKNKWINIKLNSGKKNKRLCDLPVLVFLSVKMKWVSVKSGRSLCASPLQVSWSCCCFRKRGRERERDIERRQGERCLWKWQEADKTSETSRFMFCWNWHLILNWWVKMDRSHQTDSNAYYWLMHRRLLMHCQFASYWTSQLSAVRAMFSENVHLTLITKGSDKSGDFKWWVLRDVLAHEEWKQHINLAWGYFIILLPFSFWCSYFNDVYTCYFSLPV